MCKNLFKGKGGGILGDILSIGAGLLIPGLGAFLAPELGIGAIGADAIAGAGLEGTASAIEGKNPLVGAAEGAIGGGVEGAGGIGAVAKDVGLDGIGQSVSSGLSDVGSALGLTSDAGATADSLGVPGGVASGVPATPTSAIGATGSTAPSSGIDSLNSDSVDQALNNTSGLGQAAGALTQGSAGGDISGANLGGFTNAPDVTPPPVSASGGTTGLNASDTLESGGGANWDSTLNSTPSSSASSASAFGSGPSLDAGGGIQASTGVKPVSDSLLGDLGDALSNIPVKSLAPAASLAYQAISGPPKLPASERALLGQYEGAEGAALNEYNTGVLTAPQQAELDMARQNAQNQLYQQFASQGITNPHGDTRFQQGMQQIEAQMEAQKQGYMDQASKSAGEFGTGIQNIAKDQLQQDQNYATEIDAASKALFELLG
jgi:hypothetical protein